MPRLRALNESSSDESEEDNEEKETIEAQEDRAFSLYKRALELRQRGSYSDAEELLISILNDDFLANVSPEELSDGHARPAAALKYACLKNLGNVLVLQNRAEDGLKCFIQAVELDNSDVTMWHQMGKVALQIDDFHLASRAFQEGLRCNSRHWPCLDLLLPLLYALNDYLGCLLLVSRTLELDAEYPQALALQNQIAKEDRNLIQNFKFFFPGERDISEVCCDIPEEELSNLISHALSLQERYRSKISEPLKEDLHCAKIAIKLQSNTWEDLGKNLLEVHNLISCSQGKSFLDFVKINASESPEHSDIHPTGKQNTNNTTGEDIVAQPGVLDIESEPMDVDSEQEAKGEDQTEEDATEASGLEQEEEARTLSSVQQNSAALKQKRKKTSTTLMDQWSKRRSGRRSGRKAEEREESNLASRFRSLLPDSLLPKDLEAELAKASRRRSLRDPNEILSWGDDSMDAIELCRLLQERDAKDAQKRKLGLHAKDNIPQRILQESYYGTEKEVSEVKAMVEKDGSETNNIIQLIMKFIRQLAEKHDLTWPPGLVPIYVGLYECMRKHISSPSPFDGTVPGCLSIIDVLESLLYCELCVDMWHQKSLSDSYNLGESGLTFSEALGNISALSGLNHIFTSPSEQCRILLRINWLKAHLFLLLEDSASAIYSLQCVLDSLEIVEMVGSTLSSVDDSHSSSKEITSTDIQSKTSEEVKAEQLSTEEKSQNEENLDACMTEDPAVACEQNNPHDPNHSIVSPGVVSDKTETDGQMNEVPEHDLSMVKDEQSLEELASAESVTEKNENVSQGEMSEVPEHNHSIIKDEQTLEELTSAESITEKTEIVAPSVSNLEKVNCENENSLFTSLPLKEEKINQMEEDTVKESLTDETSSLQSRDTISQETGAEVGESSRAVQSTNDNEELTIEKPDQHVNEVKQTDQLHENSQKEQYESDPSCNIQIESISPPLETDMSSGIHKSNVESEQSGSSSALTAKTKPFIVILPNCSVNQEITKRSTQKLLTSLTRQQQLSEIDDLYQSRQYELLAGTLKECFKFCAQQTDNDNSEIDNLPDRATQMAMLLDSLWQLKKYPDCFYWGEACLHEAFNRYLNSTDSDNASQDQEDHQMWATAVERLLAGLNDCLKMAGLKLMEKLPKNCLTRLVQTLTTILCHQLEQSDCSVGMAIECTTPWVILHRIVFFEEQQHPIEQDCAPSHIEVLFEAHEYMAKKGRCCLNEGILLNLILDVVVTHLQTEKRERVRDQLNHEVDQAILCLYGHPKKPVERSRKRLRDHGVHQQIELTWDRSLALLRFYEPDELPTFDSISKITPEEEQLFLKISQLVPNESNPNRYLSKVKAFLKGSTKNLPEVQCSIPQAACNLYYHLANYYMKTFKWEPAIKYYMLDVCLNPHRFDSWAGMALARAAALTSDLNSCDTFDNDVQLNRKTKAQRCFQRAVDLDPENTTMWIEFGSFAYTVHSFCSRLLKTETDSLSMEMFTKIEEEKDKMLGITEQCFKTVEKLDQEEPWLPQYMLGKVAEKRGEAPVVFLQHYRAAAKLLFDSNAVYPLSLNYDPPQHYAFEAHEVHYRIHASILKHLELMEGKCLSEEIEVLYNETLDEAAKGPFMAARGIPQQTFAKRQSVDPVENMVKKIKLDESVVMIDHNTEQDSQLPKTEDKDVAVNMDSKSSMEVVHSGQEINLSQSDNSLVTTNGQPKQIDLSKKDVMPSVTNISENMDTDCEITLGTASNSSAIEGKSDETSPKETESESCQTSQVGAEAKEKDNIVVKEPGSSSPSSYCSNSEAIAVEQSTQDSVAQKSSSQDSTKESRDAPSFVKPVVDQKSPSERSLNHADLINQCLVAMEECLARYPRHYKSFYRLCHHYFRSKHHRNYKKCRQLLLGDNRLSQSTKLISGLFKSNGVHSMFNDVWRIPIEEIDRAGSFASHMSRCVHLLMELLRALRDHAFLLKLSIFLKRDPEKKDKKYLRDNERADLSKQALVLCLAAMRECVNETRTADHVIELYRTVKDGIKELPLKEAAFKGLLSDAYKKFKGDQGDQQSYYEAAVDFCSKELSSRRAIADAKARAQALAQAQQGQVHSQVQVQAQVQDQLQAQALAQAMQMGVMSSALPFNPLSQRFPAVGNTPLRNPLADARANAMANAMVSSMATSMFLPQMPLYRGRGRPPKAQQRLHNAMMNMAHMMGLANVNVAGAPSGQSSMDSSKPKVMKQQQKQRRPQQGTGAQTTVVSSIIKDRPALSITALQANKSTGQSTGSASTPPPTSTSAPPVRTGSPYPNTTMSMGDVLMTGQTGWQQRPRHNVPRPMPGATDPRSILNPNSGAVRKEGPRLKGPATSAGAFSPQPRPFAPQSQTNAPLNNPAALLSRLPGLQIKQRAQPTSPHQQEMPTPRPQPPNKLQKTQASSGQTSNSAISISKISSSSLHSTPGSDSAENSETKKRADPNFDIITLD
ncbi:calcineurin-binding protein cabin-1-like [Thrips palmi]|uniref:Calcineurin-binding protein cabin-1-like n=1 Tax=Thrips palmi TaxID=161013 RepID=A0A6P8YZ31_THRPL|nr:calcineurin-binding protein cabin-1-like [Thrips palmi]